MKSEINKKLNTIYSVDSNEPIKITPENLPYVKSEVEPEEFDLALDGRHGIRIYNDGNSAYNTTVEVKNKNGEWEPLTAVQKISFEVSVDNPTPKVRIEQYILSEE